MAVIIFSCEKDSFTNFTGDTDIEERAPLVDPPCPIPILAYIDVGDFIAGDLGLGQPKVKIIRPNGENLVFTGFRGVEGYVNYFSIDKIGQPSIIISMLPNALSSSSNPYIDDIALLTEYLKLNKTIVQVQQSIIGQYYNTTFTNGSIVLNEKTSHFDQLQISDLYTSLKNATACSDETVAITLTTAGIQQFYDNQWESTLMDCNDDNICTAPCISYQCEVPFFLDNNTVNATSTSNAQHRYVMENSQWEPLSQQSLYYRGRAIISKSYDLLYKFDHDYNHTYNYDRVDRSNEIVLHGQYTQQYADDLAFAWIDELDVYFSGGETGVEQLVEFMGEKDINPLTNSSDALIRSWWPEQIVWDFNPNGYEDFVRGDLFAIGDPIKDRLINEYPDQLEKIDNWFNCRIFGIGFEKAILSSINFEHASQLNDESAIPDGYFTFPYVEYLSPDNFGIHSSANIIEIKAQTTGTGDHVVFNYSSNTAQFDAYRRHVKSPNNSYKPNVMLNHGLYMMLPSDVGLSQEKIIDKCSKDNIPVYLNGVERTIQDRTKIRIKSPELLNIENLNYSHYELSYLGSTVYKYVLELWTKIYLNNRTVTLDLLEEANIFENSYLIPDLDPDLDCDLDD